MNKDTIINDLETKMHKSISSLDHDLSGLRTGRASPNLLDRVLVDAYGDRMSINQVGSVNVPEPRMITVQVWDKGLVKAVEKAISNANLGVVPSSEGQLVRIPMPQLSEQRRIEIAKLAQKSGENAKISIRNIRRDSIDKVKEFEKSGESSEDDARVLIEKLQKITDKFISIIDEKVANKEKEIMQV